MRKELVFKDGGGVSGSHDTPFPKLPLKITLLGLDKRSYQMGEEDRCEYAVRIILFAAR